MKHFLSFVPLAFVFAFAVPAFAHAQVVTTPYWCGSYWSSYPCSNSQYPASPYYGQNYSWQNPYQYSYPQYSYPSYSAPYPCGYYQYNNCIQNPVIYSVAPNAGTPGTTVTVYGSGFSYRDNSVRFGNGIITGLFSSDGKTLSFVIPTTLNGFNSQYATPGTYNLTVTNADGRVSNQVAFTIPGWYYTYPTYPAYPWY